MISACLSALFISPVRGLNGGAASKCCALARTFVNSTVLWIGAVCQCVCADAAVQENFQLICLIRVLSLLSCYHHVLSYSSVPYFGFSLFAITSAHHCCYFSLHNTWLIKCLSQLLFLFFFLCLYIACHCWTFELSVCSEFFLCVHLICSVAVKSLVYIGIVIGVALWQSELFIFEQVCCTCY